jgi:hypothetical protein
MTECKRCGACCYYEKENKLVRCKYLQNTKDGKTLCKIYLRNSRLNLQIDKGTYCIPRLAQNELIENCAYNAEIKQKLFKEQSANIKHEN